MTSRTLRAPFWGAIVLVFGLLLLIGSPAHAFDVEDLHRTGDSSRRLDLVILGEGYTSGEQEKMSSDARAIIDGFWADSLFGRYREYINIRLVHVISNQSGADNGSAGGERDTAMGAFFNCANIDRLLCVDDNAVRQIAMQDAPDFDQLLVMVNDTKYGGAGGGVATTSIAPGAVDIPVHEVGHSLFGLADEYDYGGNNHEGECGEINVSRNGDENSVKWSYWNDHPDVGVFQGAHYEGTNHYRPVDNCKMRSLGQSFDPICREQAVISIMEYSGLIDSVDPASEETIELKRDESKRIQVLGPTPDPTTLKLTWLLDGVEYTTGSERSLTLSGEDIEEGSHTLEMFIEDETDWVRREVGNLLQGSASWSLSVLPAEMPPTGSGGAGSGGAGSGGGGEPFPSGGGTATGGTDASGGTTSGGSGAQTGGAPGDGEVAPTPPSSEDTGGCGCRTAPAPSRGSLLGIMVAAVAALGIRRKNARQA